MIDIRFLRENPDAVRENIRKKFQDEKLPLVDEAIRLDAEKRAAQQECEQLKAARNKLSKANGPLYGQLKKADEAQKAELQKQIEENNAKVKADDDRRAELEKKQAEAEDKLREISGLGLRFCHPSRFLITADDKETAIEACRRTLRAAGRKVSE